ncbi:MAG: hypothetical protein PF795_05605 [Kiritimatiellae bacterium]|jgi:hypothetical protein|nr:hypothetical protein [Kiritimatiellia bacterium]
MKNIENRGLTLFPEDWAISTWVDHMHQSVFHDAAKSMSALGVLAPFIESLFHEAFQTIASYFEPHHRIKHTRFERHAEDQWDCHYVWTKGRRRPDLVKGITQLAEAVDMDRFLPTDYDRLLSALFAFRNKTFHYGFEWPVRERTRFAQRIIDEGWEEEWFDKATTNEEPWIFYMSEQIIRDCNHMIDGVLDGFGNYAEEVILPKRKKVK